MRCMIALAAGLLASMLSGAPVTAGTLNSSPGTAEVVTVCPTCPITTLAHGLAMIPDGGTLILGPGVYREAALIRTDGVTIRAEGAHLRGVAAEGKAALVIKGNDTVIDGLECSGIAVPDHNGACVRLEGKNLTLRHVHFHDSEEGLLAVDGSGAILIEDSRFERLGAGGLAHGIYVNHAASLIIRRSVILASRDEGHEIKSRAAHTTIDQCVVASLDGVDSRLVDVPNGGQVVIRDSILEKGMNASNHQLIGYGLEGIGHSSNSLILERNTIIIDLPAGRLFNSTIDPRLDHNTVVGGDRLDGQTWFPDRRAANLPPYPRLPRRGQTTWAN